MAAFDDMASLTRLRERLRRFGPYPDCAVPVDEVIAGTAFFPGGDGLWKEDTRAPHWPKNGIMVLGQDFGCEMDYRRLVKRGTGELDGATWRQLLKLFAAAGVSPADCFFTNLFMGVRNGIKSTRRHPAANNPEFLRRCQSFLLHQIHELRPKAILVLGAVVPKRVAILSPGLSVWSRCGSFPEIDAAGPLIENAHFDLTDGPFATNVAALAHPSFRYINARLRRYAGLIGDAAEQRLIHDALNPLTAADRFASKRETAKML